MIQLKEALIGKNNSNKFKTREIYCLAIGSEYARDCLRNDKRFRKVSKSYWEVYLCEEDMASKWIEAPRKQDFNFNWWIGIVKDASNFDEAEKIIRNSNANFGKVIEKIAGNSDIPE